MRTFSLRPGPRLFALGLAIVAFGGWAAPSEAGELRTLATSMPGGAVAFFELSGLAPVIDRIEQSSYPSLVASSEPFQAFQKTPPYQKAVAAARIAETQLGMDLLTAAKKLLGGQVAAAVYLKPGSPQPSGVLIIRPADRDAWGQVRQRIEPFLVLAGDAIETSQSSRGEKINGLKGQFFFTLKEDAVIVATTQELLGKTLDQLAQPSSDSLANDAPFQIMLRQMGPNHLLHAYLNTDRLTKAKGSRLAPERLDNLLGSLMGGGVTELVATSPYAGLALDIEDHRLVLSAGIAGNVSKLDEGRRALFAPSDQPGIEPFPSLPALIGGFTLYRDLGAWYHNRDKLLVDQLLPEFDKFESGLANLLPGKNFEADILPLLGKRLMLVAAPQDYSHLAGSPGVKLPGFGLIVELAKPQEAADIFQLFFQTLSAILNIDAGQKGRKPWVLTSETMEGVQITFGRYLEKPTGERLPIVFNFMPASARVGNKYIICSSLSLCRDLVRQLHQTSDSTKGNSSVEKTTTEKGQDLKLEIRGSALADVVQANQEFIHARAIQQGASASAAQTELERGIQFLRNIESIRLSTKATDESYQVRLEGNWK